MVLCYLLYHKASERRECPHVSKHRHINLFEALGSKGGRGERFYS